MKKTTLMLLASLVGTLAGGVAAHDFSTGEGPTMQMHGHKFNDITGEGELASLDAKGLEFVCWKSSQVDCMQADPNKSQRVWHFVIYPTNHKELIKSILATVDFNCENYMYKVSYMQLFEDFAGNKKLESFVPEDQNWYPVSPNSRIDMAAKLACKK